MKLKIMSFVCAFVLLCTTCANAAFSDVDTQSDVGNAILQLSNLGIINGFGNNLFLPDETLTRAQFAKIAVYMLGEQKNAASYGTQTVFSDVSQSHWASEYVNYIAEREIINGYPDGSFGAEDTINYAQALTILIRLLGYGGEDVAYKWPDGYINMAASLGITKNMRFDKYESLTRGNAAYLVYNTLLAEKKENSSVKLLSSKSIEDVVIYADWETDESLSNGSILTTEGVYKLADSTNISQSIFGSMGTLYLDADNKATAFVPERETVRNITVVSAAKNTDSGKTEITFTENGVTKTESFGVNAPIYYSGKSAEIGNAVSELESGREAVLFFAESGTFERIYLKKSSLSSPITIKSGGNEVYSEFGISSNTSLTVLRGGRKSTLNAIEPFDVVYYMKSNNTIYAYTDKVTGTYEEAYPIKANVTSVSVAGREYTLSSQTAINKMNESDGAFDIGDRVTLLFGRNGEVIDAVDMTQSGNLDLAVLLECTSKISTDADTDGKRIRSVTLMLLDGSEVTYETDKDYSDYIGNVMRVNYADKKATLSYVSHNVVTGEFDSSIPSLGSHWLTSGCAVLELVENIEGEKATVKKIDVKDITSKTLTKEQVLHAQVSGEMRDISFLYVKGITKSEANFGVVKKKEKNSVTVLVDEKEKTFQTALALSNGSAVEISQTADGEILSSLVKIAAGSNVTGYTAGRIRVGTTTYTVSDYVKIYGGRNAEDYHTMSAEEMLDTSNITSVTLYSDRSAASGGIVRVIVLKTVK